jgi:hypothetical protein
MSRTGFFRASLIVAIAATLWTLSPAPANARPRFGPRAVFGLLGVPLGMFGRIARPRAHAHSHRTARHGVSRARQARRGGAAMALASAPIWVGATFWPSGYDELTAYVVGTSEADLRFWSGGFADVVAALVTPARGDGRTVSRPAGTSTASADGVATTTGAGAPVKGSACPGASADDVAEFVSDLEQRLKPTSAQKPSFEALRAALVQAGDDLRRACPAMAPASAPARLTAIQERLWAIQSAAAALRKPLVDFHADLDEAQKAHLDGRPAARRSATAAVQLCHMQAQAGGRTVERISDTVKPTAEQEAPLKTLTEVSAGMAKLMIASCPAERPATVAARLDAVLARLDAMLYAVAVVATPLQGFYASLTDEQKARFDALGGRPES